MMPMQPSQPQSQLQPQQRSFIPTPNTTTTASPVKNKSTKKRNRTVKLPEDEEKRKNFLERNRIAALKCRQRKKQWLSNLQNRVEYLTNDNDQLQMEANALRKEIMDLKTLLVAHKDCPQYNAALMTKNNYANLLPQQQPVYHQHFSS
ncbi:activating transcription factor, other eukaryote [Mucor circinelloides 1006PhL]|uniref:Activating transcription factor, other eukaryote n=1 Tax=Mucor circinelloides f. circinelloides (strain 1006PhL) TaxID=1220926 RepID=S2KCG5_MUCC1|nr:activating transcription factor, other eukaryote [Mucor circinelloides 1006PhL]